MTTYSQLSKDITKQLTKKEKKDNGIYFTPPSTVIKNIRYLKKLNINFERILEPSCGTGEFLNALSSRLPESSIVAVEKNTTIYDSLQNQFPERIQIYNDDFITRNIDDKFNLIIGNPPYFVLKKKDVPSIYNDYYTGRPNIFIIFIIKSLSLLAEDGILSFVLPKSFTNCLYYDNTRKFINENYTILNIENCEDKYIETKQETITFVIQNKKPQKKNKFVLKINNFTIFGSKKMITKIKKLYKNSTNLDKLGFTVNVGNVVWNQCKDILTTDSTQTRLIYTSDISNKQLGCKQYKNEQKKNYINKEGENKPLLVLNRGYGVGTYNFEYCLINCDFDYLIENHLVCIRSKENKPDDILIAMYKKIMSSFENEKTKEFIKLYFGNSAVNTTELNFYIAYLLTDNPADI